MSLQPNHYDALGLPSTATAEQIKRKYRELARRYHPDVNASPEAGQKILSVNQAYQILGDAGRRAAYDLDRARQQAVQQPARPASQADAPSRPRRSAAQSPNPRGPVYYNGFGRTYAQPRSEQRANSSPRAAPPENQAPASRQRSIEQVLTEAKLAFINRQFRQAQGLCQDALRINPREAIAHEILGDIFVRQGETQRASTSFSYAIQFNPRNHSAQAKLERLMRIAPMQAGGPTITYARPNLRAPSAARTSDGALAVVTLLAGAVLLITPALLAIYPGRPMLDGMGGLLALSINLLAALAAGGAAGGVLLAFYGRMRPFSEEAWSRVREDGSRSPVPLGAILGLFAIMWFYSSFLVYVGVSATRNRFSPSILRAYALTLGLVILFALAYHPQGISNAIWVSTLWAGNLIFPAVLFGWLLGDSIRLRGRM